jgi:hypothetical protein
MYLLVALAAVLSITLASCGGGGDGGVILPPANPNNALLSGEFQASTLEQEWHEVQMTGGSGSADGKGTLSAGGQSIRYNIADDRTITISPPFPAEKEYGIVSSDGNMAIITDARYVIPGSTDQDVETVVVMKKSSGLAMDAVSGAYIVSQVFAKKLGEYNFEFSTSRILLTLVNDGSGTWEILSHSAGTTGSGNLTYALNTADGTFTITTATGTDSGIFSPDGNMLIFLDGLLRTDAVNSDGLLAVGVKKSTSAPTLSGTYQVHFIGTDLNAGNYWQYASRLDGVVDVDHFDCTVLADSRGASPGTILLPVPLSSVNADGTFSINNGAAEGIVSPDGSFIAAVDTTVDYNIDYEIKLILGLRY